MDLTTSYFLLMKPQAAILRIDLYGIYGKSMTGMDWKSMTSRRLLIDSNRFSFLVTNRYLNEFRAEVYKFVACSSKVIQAEVREVDSTALSSQLPAVTEQEEKQLKQGFMDRMQAKYDFRQRLIRAEESLQFLSYRQQKDVIQESFKQVADDILREDIMPILMEQMPAYLQLQQEQQRQQQAKQAKQAEQRPLQPWLVAVWPQLVAVKKFPNG
eukprot:Skav219824  [mRNA]  locus=scaffold1238:203766:220418:- [translate_table: standard]